MATTALTKYERQDLAECEAVIERALQAFDEFGKALRDIRDRRLYREKYGTFEEYCQARWNVKSSRARQLIAAATVAEEVATVAALPPSNEAQTRPLAGLATEERQDAWSYAVATNGQPTGDQVKTAVGELADLRAAVTAAGGCWYSSREGKHLVDLPGRPSRSYSTEELREALGIETVVIEQRVTSVTPAATIEASRPSDAEQRTLKDLVRGVGGTWYGLTKVAGEQSTYFVGLPSSKAQDYTATQLRYQCAQLAERQQDERAVQAAQQPPVEQRKPEPLSDKLRQMMAEVGIDYLNSHYSVQTGETLYTIQLPAGPGGFAARPIDKNLSGLIATITQLRQLQDAARHNAERARHAAEQAAAAATRLQADSSAIAERLEQLVTTELQKVDKRVLRALAVFAAANLDGGLQVATNGPLILLTSELAQIISEMAVPPQRDDWWDEEMTEALHEIMTA